MKIGVVRAFVAAALLVTLGGAAQAQDVTVSFKGTITNIYGQSISTTLSSGHHSRGTTLTISPHPIRAAILSVGDYLHTSAPYGVTVTIGSRTFKTDPANVNFLVGLTNDYSNYDQLQSFQQLQQSGIDGVPVQIISWQLDDATRRR